MECADLASRLRALELDIRRAENKIRCNDFAYWFKHRCGSATKDRCTVELTVGPIPHVG